MSPAETAGLVVLLITALLGGGGLKALIDSIRSRRQEIAADEREARRELAEDRRDTIADREGLIDRLERRLQNVEARLEAAENGNVAKALVIRAQGDHIDVLEHHIWQGFGPPPPRRPEGV
ncbi:hypothetical protein GXB85_04755 [Cellulomonas sp. APG4]|uniref:hypothetical protein n=1 Tax=Cellulomonas sp. APG4 TaxID=1538656 RepID=UPI00137A475D|nr:hypothetical protein [Cellulomonas sp. APG4]NCT90264.1 hypothetical protein [Cellulomonas sp. APG4]